MYFLDSYAMIEYLKGNPKYVKIIDKNDICTSDFQLIELYYFGIKDIDEETAEKYYEAFSSIKVEIPEKTLKNAMKTRLEFQKKKLNLSYVDAIGYQFSLDNNIRFVTGDMAFKGLDSVEYRGK
ncbi:MAG: PIN domain-containing protein [Candidatus Micrarchaeota archaeon]